MASEKKLHSFWAQKDTKVIVSMMQTVSKDEFWIVNRVTCQRTGLRLSDEVYHPWESPKKNSTKIGQPYNCHRTKQSFDSSNKANLWVFQNHRKQGKINIAYWR